MRHLNPQNPIHQLNSHRQSTDNSSQAVPSVAPSNPGAPGTSSGQLSQIAASLTQGGGLTDLYCPKAQREARRRFRKAELEHVKQVAITEIRLVTQVQHQQIALRAAQQMAELVTAENASLGQLEREQQQLACQEMESIITGDARRQERVQAADLLPEDRELLARINHIRAKQRVKEVSREHGVRFADDPASSIGSDEPGMHDEIY